MEFSLSQILSKWETSTWKGKTAIIVAVLMIAFFTIIKGLSSFLGNIESTIELEERYNMYNNTCGLINMIGIETVTTVILLLGIFIVIILTAIVVAIILTRNEIRVQKMRNRVNNYDLLYKMEENARKELENRYTELDKRFKRSEEENRKLKGELNKNYLVEVEQASYKLTFTERELQKLSKDETLKLAEEMRRQGTLGYEDSLKIISILKGIIGIK